MSAPLWNTVDPSTIIVKDPRPRSNGKGLQFFVDVASNTNANLKFQLPRSKAPFGYNQEEDSSLNDYKRRFMYDVKDETLASWLTMIDKTIATQVKEKKTAFFPGKSKVDDAYVDKKHSKILRHQPELGNYFDKTISDEERAKYPPKIKLNCIMPDNREACEFYKAWEEDGKIKYDGPLKDNANLKAADILERGSELIPVVEIAGGWVSAIGFGIDLRVKKIIVFSKNDHKGEFNFVLDCPAEKCSMPPPPKSDVEMSEGNQDSTIKEVVLEYPPQPPITKPTLRRTFAEKMDDTDMRLP